MQTGAGALLRRFQADFPDLVYDMDLKEVVGTIGFGATSLLVRTPDKVREPQNRRAEIIVLSAL